MVVTEGTNTRTVHGTSRNKEFTLVRALQTDMHQSDSGDERPPVWRCTMALPALRLPVESEVIQFRPWFQTHCSQFQTALLVHDLGSSVS